MKHYTLEAAIKRAFKGKTLESISVDELTDSILKAELANILGLPGTSAGNAQLAAVQSARESAGSYSSAQMDSVGKSGSVGSGLGLGSILGNAGLMVGQFALNQLSADLDMRRQENFYDSHLSMQAKADEYRKAGLNPMSLAGAGVGATSAPSTPQAAPTDLSGALGTLLEFKLNKQRIDVDKERNRIQEKGIDSQIELRAEQRITQEKINQWFDANQVANISQTLADTNLSLEKINTEKVEQRLKEAGISKDYAEAALKLNQSIAQAIDNNYRDAWNRNTLALQQAQTVLAYSNSAEANERVQNLIAERQNITLQGFQIAAKTQEIQSMTRVLGFQGDISKFNVEHLAADKAWQRVGQAVSAVQGVTSAAANVVSCVSGIPMPSRPIGF